MGDQTEIRRARRGLLLSVLLVLVAGAAATYSAFRYLPSLQSGEPGAAARTPEDEATSKLWAEEDAAPAAAFEDRYPVDIAPPPGCAFPCAVTPLPKDLEGISPVHRAFVNHAYALLVQAIHLRLEAWNGLGPPRPPAGLLERYTKGTREIVAKLKAEPTPRSMEAFRDDVVAALELQTSFFDRGYEARASGQAWQQIVESVPEARQASAKL